MIKRVFFVCVCVQLVRSRWCDSCRNRSLVTDGSNPVLLRDTHSHSLSSLSLSVLLVSSVCYIFSPSLGLSFYSEAVNLLQVPSWHWFGSRVFLLFSSTSSTRFFRFLSTSPAGVKAARRADTLQWISFSGVLCWPVFYHHHRQWRNPFVSYGFFFLSSLDVILSVSADQSPHLVIGRIADH